MKGRKPTPTKLKLVRGSRRINKSEPTSDPINPSAPKHFDIDERKLWKETAECMYEMGTLTGSDLGMLEIYVEAMIRKRHAKDDVKGEYTEESTKGGKYYNMDLSVQEKAAAQAMRAAEQLGLSPSSRSRVSVKKPKKEENPFEQWKKKHKA